MLRSALAGQRIQRSSQGSGKRLPGGCAAGAASSGAVAPPLPTVPVPPVLPGAAAVPVPVPVPPVPRAVALSRCPVPRAVALSGAARCPAAWPRQSHPNHTQRRIS
jgi:hypothetical protein